MVVPVPMYVRPVRDPRIWMCMCISVLAVGIIVDPVPMLVCVLPVMGGIMHYKDYVNPVFQIVYYVILIPPASTAQEHISLTHRPNAKNVKNIVRSAQDSRVTARLVFLVLCCLMVLVSPVGSWYLIVDNANTIMVVYNV